MSECYHCGGGRWAGGCNISLVSLRLCLVDGPEVVEGSCWIVDGLGAVASTCWLVNGSGAVAGSCWLVDGLGGGRFLRQFDLTGPLPVLFPQAFRPWKEDAST